MKKILTLVFAIVLTIDNLEVSLRKGIKVFILFVVSICSYDAYGQSISVDRLEKDGDRQVMSSTKSISLQGFHIILV